MDNFTCIVDNFLNVLVGKTKNHRDIIKRFNLQDDRIRNRHFVRVRILSYENGSIAFSFDDPATAPEWFTINRTLIEKKCLYYFKQHKNDEIKQPLISDYA
jgi:hypothetical protein